MNMLMEQEFNWGSAEVLNCDFLYFKRYTLRDEHCPSTMSFLTLTILGNAWSKDRGRKVKW